MNQKIENIAKRLHVLIADKDEVSAQAIKKKFDALHDHYEVKHICTSLAEVKEYFRNSVPDVVVINYNLVDQGVPVVLRSLEKTYSETIFVAYANTAMPINTGLTLKTSYLSSFITSDVKKSELISLHAFSCSSSRNNKDLIFLSATPREMLANLQQEKDSLFVAIQNRLTCREYEVLLMFIYGYQNKIIAQRLFVSEKTISAHKRNTLKKFDNCSMSDFVIRARRELM